MIGIEGFNLPIEDFEKILSENFKNWPGDNIQAEGLKELAEKNDIETFTHLNEWLRQTCNAKGEKIISSIFAL